MPRSAQGMDAISDLTHSWEEEAADTDNTITDEFKDVAQQDFAARS